MKKHKALPGRPRVCCGLAAACLMLFSQLQAQAAAGVDSASAGFNVKVKLLAADAKPGPVTPPGNTPGNTPGDAANNPPGNQAGSACTVSSLKLPDSSQLNISCTAAEAIASRYYKMPFYTLFNANQASWVLPNQHSGIGLGTTSSLRVLHEPDDELIEVWVSW
jgi:hypothetical protein